MTDKRLFSCFFFFKSEVSCVTNKNFIQTTTVVLTNP